MWQLPQHLRKYVVEQNYDRYTPVDHAVWRFILRQLRSYLSTHAHDFYLEGLQKTGIEIDRIPRISEISAKLEKFGWRAVPVSGFIPPAAFMELQALGVLPIASDMRTISHLMYTPAPDIVHEAAGHAPMLAHPEYAEYLRQYATVARKAIISHEDLGVYEAIRKLSDLKENPEATPAEVTKAQKDLETLSANVSHISEATQLSRMNWWTAEYGLIGSLSEPKIFGAGLLSSAGEAKWCLSDKVTKLPLTIDCIEQSYDITEPQPQLYVTPSFEHLCDVLKQFSDRMAYRKGGLEGVLKAKQARTVNTIELNSGIQVSGEVSDVISENNRVLFFKTKGSTQLCYHDQELPDQGIKQHPTGFSTPIGHWRKYPDRCPSTLSESELRTLGLGVGQKTEVEFASGFHVSGRVDSLVHRDGKLILIAWTDCRTTFRGQTYFDPSWGVFDMPVGHEISSVFGGPADRIKFGSMEDFVAPRVPARKFTPREERQNAYYREIQNLRENPPSDNLENDLTTLVSGFEKEFTTEWLLWMQAYELAIRNKVSGALQTRLKNHLETLKRGDDRILIDDGMALASQI